MHPLLGNNPSNPNLDIQIKAEPDTEYLMSRVLNRGLPYYVHTNDLLHIQVETKEHESAAVYTERQVAKNQLRLEANVRVLDKDYTELGSRKVDSFTTYEVCDDMPFSVVSAKKQARTSVTNDLANSIVLAIHNILSHAK
jgi:hypothetical protein